MSYVIEATAEAFSLCSLSVEFQGAIFEKAFVREIILFLCFVLILRHLRNFTSLILELASFQNKYTILVGLW